MKHSKKLSRKTNKENYTQENVVSEVRAIAQDANNTTTDRLRAYALLYKLLEEKPEQGRELENEYLKRVQITLLRDDGTENPFN